ncbi:MAG TPA: DUF418 domain-containing protein [Marinilabiliaceae bacterium]|nr:DUF418 domain-containing protein [Marinilabiliaceae bacterium]
MAKTERLTVVDALRGFAILSIMLLHNIEHFELYVFPEYLPQWMKVIDSIIWDSLFFLFGGKSYAIFALLFGLTYSIQYNNQQQRGNDFSSRFLWRLLLLFVFGIINSVFYQGDILAIYAVIGIILIPFRKLSNKVVLIATIFLMIQPLEWGKIIYILIQPDYTQPPSQAHLYFAKIGNILTDGSFWEVAKSNLSNGRIAVYYWSLENGRFFQTAGLFLLGFLLGRTNKFNPIEGNKQFWQKTLIFSTLTFIPLYLLKEALPAIEIRPAIISGLKTTITSWTNFSFMLLLTAGFVLLFEHTFVRKALNQLSPLGRMSLSNYVLQSLVGSFIYYGYGLGMYAYTGATLSLTIGIVLAILQTLFSTWWLKNHKRGPLEQIWHNLTWL